MGGLGGLVPGQNSGKMMLSERWMDSRYAEYAGTFQFTRPLGHQLYRKLKVSLENILVIEYRFGQDQDLGWCMTNHIAIPIDL